MMHLETKVLKNGKVFYRIMPQENMKWEYVKLLDDRKTIFMRYLQELSAAVETPSFWTFQSDYVFWNNAQEDVYQTVMDGVLERVLGGTNAIITAFGQTGTGKSLTANGLNCLYKDRGLLPRIITDIFQAKAAQEMNNVKVCMQISYVEISRQVLVDLLKPYPNINDAIKNVKKVKVEDEEQVLRYLFIGEGRKEFASNYPYLSNAASSIFTFCVTTRDVKMHNTPNVVSYLHVIDLAGADTVGNTSCLFKQPQDIGTGNLAKTQLEQFLLILNEDIPDVIKVKYRLNTMIQYLGDALSNKSILHFIGHIKIAREDLAMTISMLRFGQIILGLKPKMNDTAHPNGKKDLDCPEKLRLIQNELDQLKRDNKFSAILENNKALSTGISADRYGHIERTVTEYAQDKINEIELIQVADVNVALEVFKKKLKVAEEENKRQGSALTAALKQKASGSVKESRTSLRSATAEQRKSFTDKSNGTIRNRRSSKDDTKSSNIGLRAGSSIIKKSSSNLVAKNQSQTNRRKSATSNASITLSKKGSKMKSKTSTLMLIPEMVPEHAEAWTSYVRDRFNEYHDFITLYEVNENATRAVYKAYLDDVNALQDAVLKFEKSKNDLMLSRMTRDYQDVLRVDSEPTDFEITCLINAEKIENELLQRREAVLKSQAELRIHVDVCKNIKRDVKNAFEDYCKEKYQMPVEDVGVGGVDSELMDAEQIILHEERELRHEESEAQEEPNTSFTTEYERALLFESMKLLITREFRKKNLYKEKHNDWKKVYKIERQK